MTETECLRHLTLKNFSATHKRTHLCTQTHTHTHNIHTHTQHTHRPTDALPFAQLKGGTSRRLMMWSLDFWAQRYGPATPTETSRCHSRARAELLHACKDRFLYHLIPLISPEGALCVTTGGGRGTSFCRNCKLALHRCVSSYPSAEDSMDT